MFTDGLLPGLECWTAHISIQEKAAAGHSSLFYLSLQHTPDLPAALSGQTLSSVRTNPFKAYLA